MAHLKNALVSASIAIATSFGVSSAQAQITESGKEFLRATENLDTSAMPRDLVTKINTIRQMELYKRAEVWNIMNLLGQSIEENDPKLRGLAHNMLGQKDETFAKQLSSGMEPMELDMAAFKAINRLVEKDSAAHPTPAPNPKLNMAQ